MQQLSLLNDFSPQQSTSYPSDLVDININHSYGETETLLEEHFEMELARFETLDIGAIPENDVTAKFKFSSALQKSIRRGYVDDAIRYAQTYHSLDSQGFWTRIVVIGFEEVSLGGVWELALTLIAAKSKVWRQKVGGDIKILQFIVKALTEAIKDRSVCDQMQNLWHSPRKFKVMQAFRTASIQELVEMAVNERNPSSLRASAAWIVAGTNRYENKMLPLRSGSKEVFFSMIEKMKLPPIIKYITLRGMTACRYPMFIVFPFLFEKMQKSLYFNVEKTVLPERYYIDGLPEESFDQYVRIGKSSFAYFSKACKPVNDWLTCKGIITSDARMAAIGAAVFISEGALLNRRLAYEGADEIYEMAEMFDYQNAGLSLDDGRTLAGMIEANSDILRQSRIRVVMGERS